MDFPGGSSSKESTCNAGDLGLIPGLGRFPWRKAWQPTPIFLPGESQGQRSLADYSPWHCKESVMTEWLSTAHKAENNLLKQWFSVSVCLGICWWTYEYRSLGPTFRVPDSVVLGQDLRICISSKVMLILLPENHVLRSTAMRLVFCYLDLTGEGSGTQRSKTIFPFIFWTFFL